MKNKNILIYPIIGSISFLTVACSQEQNNEENNIENLKLDKQEIILDKKKEGIDYGLESFHMNETNFAYNADIFDHIEKQISYIKTKEDADYFIENVLVEELSEIHEERMYLLEDTMRYYKTTIDKSNYDLFKIKTLEERNINIYKKIYQLFALTEHTKKLDVSDDDYYLLKDVQKLLDVYVFNHVRYVTLTSNVISYNKGEKDISEYEIFINPIMEDMENSLKDDISNYIKIKDKISERK